MGMSKDETVARCHSAVVRFNQKYFKAKELQRYGITRTMAKAGLATLHSDYIIERVSSDHGGSAWEWLEWRELGKG